MESIAARAIQVFAALGGAYLVALWFVLVVWTFRDIETRSKNVLTQVFSTLLVVLFYVPGVLLYLILRPKETLDAAFQRSLEEEYLLQDLEELPVCKNCQHYVEDDFMICPHCQTHLRDACVACTRLVDLRWNVCPYCSTEQTRIKEENAIEKVPQPAARWVAPTVLKRRVLRQASEAPATDLPSPTEISLAPVAIALATVQNGAQPLPPVRLFDRRKTREAARLNGYRRPAAANGNNVVINGATLVDRFGRKLDPDTLDVEATNGHSSMNGNGHSQPAPFDEEAPVRATIAAEETGD
jgi:RNA polymerase subunit RPABC4/transcription elongation factor Spt4